MEANLLESTHEFSQLQFSDQVNGKSGPSVFYESGFPGVKVRHNVRGLLPKLRELLNLVQLGMFQWERHYQKTVYI